MTGQARVGSIRSVLARTACVLAVVFTAVAAGAGTAAAAPSQSCDPFYGCPPGPPPSTTATCSLSSGSTVSPNESVTGHIEGVADGAEVTVRFDGAVVGQGTAHTAPGATTASADIAFTVPGDVGPGDHNVVFSGAGFSCTVTVSAVAVGGVEVSGSEQTTGGGTSGSSLARTGIEVALLLAVALALVVAGMQFVRAARRRRRRLSNRVRADEFVR